MKALLDKQTEKGEEVLKAIAHMPTLSLGVLMDNDFAYGLTDADLMRVAVYLAQKSYEESGCPIGALIIDNATRQIVGKGHNTLVQDNHPYNHGETSAIRDAGRMDFSKTTLFTSLSPCDICATLIYMRGFSRVVVGDVTNAAGNEALLQERGIHVDILEDRQGIELYARFRTEKPDQDLEDWLGLGALQRGHVK
ncbi:MAG: creatinine deaminase [Motiliproteus sp.]|jgi:creatinine deaminase